MNSYLLNFTKGLDLNISNVDNISFKLNIF